MRMQDRVSRSEDVLFREMQGETVLLHTGTGVYLGLDEVGTRIWALLGEADSLQKVRDRIVEEFDVDAATFERDLLGLVEKMEEHGLVTVGA